MLGSCPIMRSAAPRLAVAGTDQSSSPLRPTARQFTSKRPITACENTTRAAVSSLGGRRHRPVELTAARVVFSQAVIGRFDVNCLAVGREPQTLHGAAVGIDFEPLRLATPPK